MKTTQTSRPSKQFVRSAQIKALLLLSASALGACANTPNQIRSNPPRVSAVARPADRVAACFLERYDGLGWSKFVQTSPRADGGTTIKKIAKQVPVGQAFAFVVDIIPTASGSDVRIYEEQMVTSFDRKIFDACTV